MKLKRLFVRRDAVDSFLNEGSGRRFKRSNVYVVPAGLRCDLKRLFRIQFIVILQRT